MTSSHVKCDAMVIKNTNITQLPVSIDTRPKSKYQEFVDALKLCKNARLRVIIDCQRCKPLLDSNSGLVGQLDCEIKLWSGIIGPRVIQSLYIIHPYSYLEPFELTRMLHEIASRFRMATDPNKSFAVVSEINEINSEHLALVKGLGFTRYQIIIQESQLADLKLLSRKLRWAKEFAFAEVGIQIVKSHCLQTMRSAIKQLEQECKPDYICVGKAWDSLEVLASATHLENEVIDGPNIDVLEFGPDGVCKIGEHKMQNYSSPEKYRASLDVERLPIHLNTFHQS